MSEELIEKLKSVLIEKGVDEGTSNEILAELDAGEAPIAEEPSPAPENETEPVEEAVPIEAPNPEEVITGDGEGEVTEAVIPQPTFDFEGLQSKLDESNKTIEALLARVESLEEALKNANVIEGEVKPVGFNKADAPDKEPIDDGLGDFLRRANRHSY